MSTDHPQQQSSLVRALVSFCVPLVLASLLQQLYNWADAFIVGNIEGEAALAAVGATTVVVNFFVQAITGFCSGVSILSARRFGQGDREAQPRILSTFLIALGGAAVTVAALTLVFSRPLLTMMRTPADIFPISLAYLRVILLGIPFLTLYNVCAAILRGIGDSKAPFYAVVVSSLSNVALDLLFVGPFGWGAAGAAAATVLAQALMAVYIWFYARRKHPFLLPVAGQARTDGPLLRQGCRLALPIALQSVVSSFGNLILQNFMNGFGTPTVAAITTAYRVDSVIMLPVINLGTGIATLVSQNTGAGDHARARDCLKAGIALSALVSLGMTAIVQSIGGPVIALFGVGPESAAIGAEFFRCISWFYLVFGLCMAIRGYLDGIGDVVFAGLNRVTSLAVRIGLSYLLAPLFFNMVIAYAEAISWCLMLALYLLRYSWRQSRLRRTGSPL
ncbi:MAG: MATE family efflux transporter [Clostridia bacterium]|nr:MATE family efflux transporter [Clostridia bacterium]MBQ3078091.1 MATE family efflux transporter [Clostridia bacterium]